MIRLMKCPFCGGKADFFECERDLLGTTWQVGCVNPDVDCIGTLMVANYARKEQAAVAWNTRHTKSYHKRRQNNEAAEIPQPVGGL